MMAQERDELFLFFAMVGGNYWQLCVVLWCYGEWASKSTRQNIGWGRCIGLVLVVFRLSPWFHRAGVMGRSRFWEGKKWNRKSGDVAACSNACPMPLRHPICCGIRKTNRNDGSKWGRFDNGEGSFFAMGRWKQIGEVAWLRLCAT